MNLSYQQGDTVTKSAHWWTVVGTFEWQSMIRRGPCRCSAMWYMMSPRFVCCYANCPRSQQHHVRCWWCQDISMEKEQGFNVCLCKMINRWSEEVICGDIGLRFAVNILSNNMMWRCSWFVVVFWLIWGHSVAQAAAMEAYGWWQRAVEGWWAVIVVPAAAGDGGGSAPSWLFLLALCVFYAWRDFRLNELWTENSFMSERSRCCETPNYG
jgi:hypothetical protein